MDLNANANANAAGQIIIRNSPEPEVEAADLVMVVWKPLMVVPISCYAPPPVQPVERKTRLLKMSKLSFEFDANKNTLARVWHDAEVVMIPSPDEMQLSHPQLLKGWDVKHTERRGGHKDKFYSHVLRQEGAPMKSLKQVEEYIMLLNFPDADSLTFLDGARPVKRARASAKKQDTAKDQEAQKA